MMDRLPLSLIHDNTDMDSHPPEIPDQDINVTKPFLPPLEELQPYLNNIWSSHILTNNGNYHREFETALAQYLGVPYVSLFTNGTLALLIAIRCLDISGEIITTPYSFVATSHAIQWNRNKPVFVDINEDNCCMDPNNTEHAITPETSAILPVHVYGFPCDVDHILQPSMIPDRRDQYPGYSQKHHSRFSSTYL